MQVLNYEKTVLDFFYGKAEDMTSYLPAIYTMAGHRASMTEQTAWQFIRWQRVVHRVKSLQSRIVKAVKAKRWNLVKKLQGLLAHSFASKLLAIRRITENSGKRTAGIDGQKWNTPIAKYEAIAQLQSIGYKPLAVRRIKIKKSNGKHRPLGIPTMRDRAMQTIYLHGLDPVSESLADINSYGFRKSRSCADAIARCFSILAKKDSPVWILEGDIKGCFDHISHEWMLENIPMNKTILEKWLKAGCFEKRTFFSTEKGTPQGAIISPTLANIVLDGMETAIDKACNVKYWGKKEPKRRINPNHVHLIRYADDFVISCSDKSILEQIIKPAIVSFLLERGLELSPEKTTITHIDKGFDFLGQNVRKYKGKLLIKPSKKNVAVFLSKVKVAIKERTAAPALDVIRKLAPMIRGWAMYHRHVVSKQTFYKVDNEIWMMLWKWSRRRHSKRKSKRWIKQRYFTRHEGRDWTFFAKNEMGGIETILYAGNITIIRHPKVRGDANPYDRMEESYFEKRMDDKMLNKLDGKHMMRYLYDRQNGLCLVCNKRITVETGWNNHHLIPKHLGGKWIRNNLVMLHPVCHIQVHQNESVAAALTKAL